VNWGEALAVPSFYNREREVATLTRWVLEERCRVVSVLGLGGIGKSALAVTLMHQLAPHFEVVLWRSLRDAPACDGLLEDCLRVLAPEPLANVPASLDGRLDLLLDYLREERALLVLDNLEVLLEEGAGASRMRAGYEGYARLLRRVAATEHQSCLLLTSREKLGDLVPLEGTHTPVRAMRLEGLEPDAGEQLLEERELVGSVPERKRLVERYGGNPLALKIVAGTIVELFGGAIAEFLAGGELVFGSVRELLEVQFARLSAVEQTVLLWLAVLCEPVSLEVLLEVLATPLSRAQVMDAVEALRRRSLIEQGHLRGSFTLQAVVLEYATARLIAEMASAIEQGQLARLIEHRLVLASTKEYMWQTQQRLIVDPLLEQLRNVYQGRDEVEQRLLVLLDQLRERADYAQGYGPANIISLLRTQRGHLRGLDLSQLTIRGVALQGVEMQDAALAGASVPDTTFTEVFDAIWAVATSLNGRYWAAASKRGEVRVWDEEGQRLRWNWQAHTDTTCALAFSPDGRTLATGSWDSAVKLWDLESGSLLWTGWHPAGALSVAFAPDGRTLASGGDDGIIWLWDAHRGTLLQTLSDQSGPVFKLVWSPDGGLLASGGFDRQIRLWEMQRVQEAQVGMRTPAGHTNLVTGLAFAPDGRTLASGGWDRTIKLWDVASGDVLQTLTGHTDFLCAVAWSPDGRLLASCSADRTIRLWDIERGTSHMVFNGHASIVYSLAFTPDSRSLLSGSDDGTLRVWDVESGECVRIMQGYAVSLYDVAWSPDGSRLASAGSDLLVTIWDGADRTSPRVLRGHRRDVYGVAWSPDGRFLASGSYQHGVQVWEVTTGTRRWVGRSQPTRIRRVAWCPDGSRLASGGDDGSIYLWETSDGARLRQFPGYRCRMASVAWSPEGTRLASGGGSSGKGELFVWDARSGERLYTFNEPSEIVLALAWSPTGAVLVSGGSDGMLRWWALQRGECVSVRKAHQGAVQSLKSGPDGQWLASCGDDGAIQVWDLAKGEHLRTLRRDRPYESLNISGVRGLTEAQRATLRALGAIEEREVPLTK
jgi:WD40 repeat protein